MFTVDTRHHGFLMILSLYFALNSREMTLNSLHGSHFFWKLKQQLRNFKYLIFFSHYYTDRQAWLRTWLLIFFLLFSVFVIHSFRTIYYYFIHTCLLYRQACFFRFYIPRSICHKLLANKNDKNINARVPVCVLKKRGKWH